MADEPDLVSWTFVRQSSSTPSTFAAPQRAARPIGETLKPYQNKGLIVLYSME